MSSFLQEAQSYLDARAQFESGQIKPVPYSDLREKHLCAALVELATLHGVTLQQPIYFDSRAEVNIVSMPDTGADPRHGAGRYSGSFVEILNRHNPRTGIQAGATLLPENGWCRMFHFDLERMIVAEREQLLARQAQQVVPSNDRPRTAP